MSAGLVQAAYIIAAIFFIMSLAGLSKQESARAGNYYGIAGMAIALIATIFRPDAQGLAWVLLAMVIGGGIGIHYAKKVEMTEMPELVAILHSFVGMAAVLVGYNSYIDAPIVLDHAEHVIHLVEVFIGVFIGAVTFTGSIVAFGKLRGIISSSSLNLPHKHKLNLAAIVVSTLLMIYFVNNGGSMFALIIMTLIAFAFG
ncbi:NAD(P)(+) transhydrogenase (Re/Si-specific) subunit beta, partial [Vibrio sp. V05_P4A8T149]